MHIKTHITRLISGLILLPALCPLYAQDSTPCSPKCVSAAALRPDIEFDPTPYFEHGYSGHAGIGWSHWRVEAEILRTDVPEWLQSKKGFNVSYRGGGAKLQYFLSPQQRGRFLGVRTEVTHESVRLQHSDLKAEPLRHDFGIDSGYRFRLGPRAYVTPWAGVGYTFDAHDFQVSGRTYKDSRFDFFAAVHLGFRF